MRQLIVGDKIIFETIDVPGQKLGDVSVSNNGIDVKDLFRAVLDVNEYTTVELSGYARGEDGKLISIYELNEDDHPELTSMKKEARKFIVSGKIELTLEEEIYDETLGQH